LALFFFGQKMPLTEKSKLLEVTSSRNNIFHLKIRQVFGNAAYTPS